MSRKKGALSSLEKLVDLTTFLSTQMSCPIPAKKLKLDETTKTMTRFEDIFMNAGFYHIANNLWYGFDFDTLIKCRGVSKTWKDFIESEFPNITQVRNDIMLVRTRKQKSKSFFKVHPNYKAAFEYYNKPSRFHDLKIFISFLADYVYTEFPIIPKDQDPIWANAIDITRAPTPFQSPLRLAYQTKFFPFLRVLFKTPNPLAYFEDLPYRGFPGDSVSFMLEHKEKIDFDVPPDELLKLVIYYTWKFHKSDELDEIDDSDDSDDSDEPNEPNEPDAADESDEEIELNEEMVAKHDKLIKDVIDYCELKHKNFMNQRRNKENYLDSWNRKTAKDMDDGNTPLHFLQITTLEIDRGVNCAKISKTSLRRIFQFYIKHGIDMSVRNDEGKTPWDMKDPPLTGFELAMNHGIAEIPLPTHYLEVLTEFNLH